MNTAENQKEKMCSKGERVGEKNRRGAQSFSF
jgi:hypothetical protein